MVSNKGDDPVGAAPARERPTVLAQLEEKRNELRDAHTALATANRDMDTDEVVRQTQRISVLTGFIATLEVDAEIEMEREARQLAETRVLGIRKAIGSLSNELDEDATSIRTLYAQLVERINRINARYRETGRLRAEAAALVDRFALAEKPLPLGQAPSVKLHELNPLPVLLDVEDPARFKPHVEEHAFTGWKRRTFEEVAGTKGHEIISRVGPKPWPPISPEQQAQLDTAKMRREREQAAIERVNLPFVPPEGEFPIAGIY